MSEKVTFQVPGFKIRSEKGNRRPSKRYKRTREMVLSEAEINEAMDYLGGSHVLQPYRSVR